MGFLSATIASKKRPTLCRTHSSNGNHRVFMAFCKCFCVYIYTHIDMHIKAYSQHPLLQSVIHTIKYMSHVAHKQNRSTYVAKAKQEPTKVSFFCLLVWRDMLPKIQTHLDVSQTQQALSSFCERCAVRPDPVNKLSSHKTRLPIYRLSSSRFRLSYSKVRQKAFSDFVQFRHTQSLLHMWDELTAQTSA